MLSSAKVSVGVLGALWLFTGCRSESNELMPLVDKSHWNYLVRSVNSYTDRLNVSGRIAVGDTNGYVLKSNLGITHLGWSHGRLICDQMAGGRFRIPITLLAPDTKSVTWAGWIDWGDRQEPAKAVTVTEPQKHEVNGAMTSLICSTINIKLPGKELQITNWFKPGLGLVRQEQQTNGRVDLLLEYLDQS